MFIQVLGVLQETFSSFRVLMGLEIYDTMNPVETGRKLNVHNIRFTSCIDWEPPVHQIEHII